jgi:hypothetical protein
MHWKVRGQVFSLTSVIHRSPALPVIDHTFCDCHKKFSSIVLGCQASVQLHHNVPVATRRRIQRRSSIKILRTQLERGNFVEFLIIETYTRTRIYLFTTLSLSTKIKASENLNEILDFLSTTKMIRQVRRLITSK